MTAGEFDFSFDGESNRQAYRTSIPGLELSFSDSQIRCAVADFSATGLSFLAGEGSFHEGNRLSVDLLLNNKVFLHAVPLEIVRLLQDNTLVACTFQVTDRRMQTMLDKFVLEVQKRFIERKKNQKI